ncbi:MAG: hypothetical protein AAGL90_11510 [Pseudomonadota bacterium]
MTEPEVTHADADALLKAQKRRNVWLAFALVAFVVIVGVTTAIRIQETDFSGGDRLYFSGYLDEAEKEAADREAEARYEAFRAEEAARAASLETDNE